MKLNLLDSVGSVGVITEVKPFIRDRVEIEVDREGALILTGIGNGREPATMRTFKVFGGRAVLEDYELPQGVSKLVFNSADGKEYACGELHRNGRFVHTKNNLDVLVVDLAIAYEALSQKCEDMAKEISTLKHQYGITII